MNPRLIQAVARSSQEEVLAETQAARRAARLRTHPKFAAELVRSILAVEQAPRAPQPPRSGRRDA